MIDNNCTTIEYNHESFLDMLNSIFSYQKSFTKLLKAMYEKGFEDTILIQSIVKILDGSYEYIRLLACRLDKLEFNEFPCPLPIEFIRKMERYFESMYDFSRRLYASPYFRENISQLTSNILRELNDLRKLIWYHKDENDPNLIWTVDFVCM